MVEARLIEPMDGAQNECINELEVTGLQTTRTGVVSCHSNDYTTSGFDVLEDSKFINDHAIDVSISRTGVEGAAQTISALMREKCYSPKTWSSHELHPSPREGETTVDFIFTMDLLNFSFWSEESAHERFAIMYKGRPWTGYWSMIAALQRALEEGIPITTPSFWHSKTNCTDEVIANVFRSATAEPIPLLPERIASLREAGDVLCEAFGGRFANCISAANKSAISLVNILVTYLRCFRDVSDFENRTIKILKRAQILVADLWACFEGKGFGEFHDIDRITVFADYRIPQMLHTLGCLQYSPSLDAHIRRHQLIESGSRWEVELRGCSIWAVELIIRAIKATSLEQKINVILIDFFLYDTVKEREAAGLDKDMVPHHRTRSIWY